MKLSDEMLKNVSGGKLNEADEDSIICWLRLKKDMGDELDNVLEEIRSDFNAKIDYYDLIDTDGNAVDLNALENYVREYWEMV